MVRVAIILAVAAVLVAIGVFALPLAFTEEWSWRANVGSTLTTAIALMLGAVALLVTARVESSDYKAQQQTKTDLARLLATLAMIENKGALARTGQIKAVDFKHEAETIEKFANSTTGFAMYNLLARKSRAARNQGEEWRLFFMYIAELTAKHDDPALVINRAVRIQEMLLKLTQDDLRLIGRSVSDLVAGIADFNTALDENVVIKAMRNVIGKEQGGADRSQRQALFIRKLRFLKAKGVDDPTLDMFLAVAAQDAVALKAARERGAEDNMTDTALLQKYAAELTGFAE
jgi:hypothetical protein